MLAALIELISANNIELAHANGLILDLQKELSDLHTDHSMQTSRMAAGIYSVTQKIKEFLTLSAVSKIGYHIAILPLLIR